MERVRPPRPSEDSGFETIGPLPSTASLAQLVEVVRSPGVLRRDVDALLRGLVHPLAPDESPRARADFLLSLIESPDVSDMCGSDKRTVRSVAVQALLDLGYPYALELPPEALDELPRTREQLGEQELPLPGLIATGMSLLVQCSYALPIVLNEANTSAVWTLIFLGAVLGPTLSAVLGGWKRVLWLQRLGLGTMMITGTLWLLGSYSTFLSYRYRPSILPDIWFSLATGLGFLFGAAFMRRPGWLARGKAKGKARKPDKDKVSDKDTTRPAPP